MLRFFRFQSSLGFRGDRKTEEAITPHLLEKISPERIREEVTKLLVSPRRSGAFRINSNRVIIILCPRICRGGLG